MIGFWSDLTIVYLDNIPDRWRIIVMQIRSKRKQIRKPQETIMIQSFFMMVPNNSKAKWITKIIVIIIPEMAIP